METQDGPIVVKKRGALVREDEEAKPQPVRVEMTPAQLQAYLEALEHAGFKVERTRERAMAGNWCNDATIATLTGLVIAKSRYSYGGLYAPYNNEWGWIEWVLPA